MPERPHVGIRPDRSVTADTRGEAVLHWTTYAPAEVLDGVTSPVRTVLDCSRDLPFPEALAVADSALRHDDVTRDALLHGAQVLRGPGAARARRVASYADGRAANPFESVLRGIVTEEASTWCRSTPWRSPARSSIPNVAEPLRGIAIEVDSWGSHAGRRQHDRDCARYNALVVSGWLVLRFTWEEVMLSPSYVRWVVRQLSGPDVPLGPEHRADTPRAAA